MLNEEFDIEVVEEIEALDAGDNARAFVEGLFAGISVVMIVT